MKVKYREFPEYKELTERHLGIVFLRLDEI